MLVLTRKIRESIWIANDVEVVVLASRNGKVRLGISCPDHVSIDRGEIHQRRKSPHPRSLTDPAGSRNESIESGAARKTDSTCMI
jgi:carbon storage regulator